MGKREKELVVVIRKPGNRIISKIPLKGIGRVVFVYNRQFTNAPNTTQIASGAGKSSAAGSNAAIRSSYTYQQGSVGAGGKAVNNGPLLMQRRAQGTRIQRADGSKEAIIVVNEQIVKLPKGSSESSATQIASGGGGFSTGGTNSAIESRGTRQQQAVGGGSGSKGINVLGGKRKAKRHQRRRAVR